MDFHEILYFRSVFFENMSRKLKFYGNVILKNGSAPTGRDGFSCNLKFLGIFKKYAEKIKVLSKYDFKKRVGFHGTRRIFVKFEIFRNFSKICQEN